MDDDGDDDVCTEHQRMKPCPTCRVEDAEQAQVDRAEERYKERYTKPPKEDA